MYLPQCDACTHNTFISVTYFGVKIKTMWRAWCLPCLIFSSAWLLWEFASRQHNVTKVKTVSDCVELSQKTCPVLRLNFALEEKVSFWCHWWERFGFSANMKLGRVQHLSCCLPTFFLSLHSVHMEFWMFCVGCVCFRFGSFRFIKQWGPMRMWTSCLNSFLTNP